MLAVTHRGFFRLLASPLHANSLIVHYPNGLGRLLLAAPNMRALYFENFLLFLLDKRGLSAMLAT